MNRLYKVKVITCLLLAAAILFFVVEFICWRVYLSGIPARTDWFLEDFSDGIKDWETLDATYMPFSHEAEGVMQLAKDKFFAPFANQKINLTRMGQESFVFHFRVYNDSFQGDAVTLGSIVYSTGVITIVQNKKGELGLSPDLMTEASYSTNSLAKINQKEWQDIYLLYDNSRQTVRLLNGKSTALTEEEYPISTPLLEIWLGAIWIGGSENYGAPAGIEYDEVSVSNPGILPKPAFIEFIVGQFIRA